MPFLSLNGITLVNSDNVFKAELIGRSILLTSPAGETSELTFPDQPSAAAAYKTFQGILMGAPFLTSAFPSQGNAAGGTTFVLVGGGFIVGGTDTVELVQGVSLGTAVPTVVDERTISCAATPAGAVGPADIVYTRSTDGLVATLVAGWEYV